MCGSGESATRCTASAGASTCLPLRVSIVIVREWWPSGPLSSTIVIVTAARTARIASAIARSLVNMENLLRFLLVRAYAREGSGGAGGGAQRDLLRRNAWRCTHQPRGPTRAADRR